jgi:hypothetical protein
VLAVAAVGAVSGFKPAAAVVFVAAMVVLTALGYELHRRAIGIRPVAGPGGPPDRGRSD